MRVPVLTRNNVKIMLDVTKIKSQREIIAGSDSYYQLTFHAGNIMDISHCLSNIPLEPAINITPKLSKYIERIQTKILNPL